MAQIMASKTLTVRLPAEIYSTVQKMAQQRAISLNTLLHESLLQTIRANEEQQRYDEYSLLGQEIELCDVEYAIHAQAEVMLNAELS